MAGGNNYLRNNPEKREKKREGRKKNRIGISIFLKG